MNNTQPIKSALVVGGCGSLGHRIVQGLLKLEPPPQVSVFDLQTTHNRLLSVEYYDIDITIKDQVFSTLRKARPQVIFHTASPPPSLLDLGLYMKVNVEGTSNLVECAKVNTEPGPTRCLTQAMLTSDIRRSSVHRHLCIRPAPPLCMTRSAI
jgi:nucleoside-diphosphate-sugar epimerase